MRPTSGTMAVSVALASSDTDNPPTVRSPPDFAAPEIFVVPSSRVNGISTSMARGRLGSRRR